MIVVPMSPEKRRRFDRILWREQVVRTLEIALPIVIGGGIFIALIWLQSRGGPAWIGLTLASAALAKPVLVVIRVLEKRRLHGRLD